MKTERSLRGECVQSVRCLTNRNGPPGANETPLALLIRLLTSILFPYFPYHYFPRRMRLKGQMIYVPETDLVLFLCSPSVLNLDDLNRRGLYLSDIPLHDSTRDLILLSEQFEAEYKLTKNLEILTDKLQQTYRELEDEKRKTDRYVNKSYKDEQWHLPIVHWFTG